MIAITILAATTTLATFCAGIFIGRTLGEHDWTWFVTFMFATACALLWPLALGFAALAVAFCLPVSVLYVVCVLMPVGVISALRGKAVAK